MSAGRGRVLMALSGGVDSSVAAAMLRDEGHEVIGITLRYWLCEEGEAERARSCCGLDGVADASAAAGQLGLRHYVVDCRERFEQQVLRPSWEAYDQGLTPNPCVLCNQQIKLVELREHARRLGAQLMATGHHARVEQAPGGPRLLRGQDRNKDQSYFLFAVEAQDLARTLFPVGQLTKQQVRQRADALGLPNAQRAESQDACLGGDHEPFAEALRRRFGAAARPGEVVDPQGQVLGQHQGVHLYTVGQRRGLGLALGRRAYVTGVDAARQQVVLGGEQQLMASGLVAGGLRWLVPPQQRPAEGEPVEVQIRYRHRACPARALVDHDAGTVTLSFETPQRAVTPGQAAVLYRGDQVLGGGWIKQAVPI